MVDLLYSDLETVRGESVKTVAITGGAGGIGSAICRRFQQGGYRVIIGYRTNREKAMQLAQELGGAALEVDVRSADSVKQFAEKAGRVDVLIHNAGIAQQKLFTDISEAEWDEMFAVHAKGAFLLCRAFLPQMIREKSGSIVNIASMWGQVGASCEVHYSAAKAALIGMTRALAKEVGPSGIRVNCVSPGVIETDMMQAFSEEDKQNLAEETPLGRLGTPFDVAEAVFYAANATFLTGQVIAPNGGFVI